MVTFTLDGVYQLRRDRGVSHYGSIQFVDGASDACRGKRTAKVRHFRSQFVSRVWWSRAR